MCSAHLPAERFPISTIPGTDSSARFLRPPPRRRSRSLRMIGAQFLLSVEPRSQWDTELLVAYSTNSGPTSRPDYSESTHKPKTCLLASDYSCGSFEIRTSKVDTALRSSLAFLGSVRYQLRVQATETLRHVTVPADRLINPKNVWELFRSQIFPFRRLEVGAEQSGRVIPLVQRADQLAAEHAALSFIPL